MKTRKTKKRNIIRRTVAFLLCMTMVLGLGMQDVIEQVYAEEAIPVIEQEAATEEAGELTTEGAGPEENAETAEEPDESVEEAEEQPANSTPSQPADAEENTKTDVPSAPAENAGSEEGEKQNPSAPAEDGQSGSDSETSAETNPGGNTGNEITAPAEDGNTVTNPDETTGEDTEDDAAVSDEEEETTEPEEDQEPAEEEAQVYDKEETVGNVTIHVYAEAGVLPEDAELSVTPIEKKEITEDMSEEEKAEAEEINAQYEETEQKLTEQLQEEAAEETETLAAENVPAGVNTVSESADADAETPVVEKILKGFLSYDISFLGENGEEIEPEGEVQVSFEFAEAVLPDETSENMEVAVKHFKEEKNSDGEEEIVVEDLTEAETTNIETEGENGAAVTKVELVADSFSPYTIVWYENIYDWNYKDSVDIYYINTDGEEIDAFLSGEDLKQYGEDKPIVLEDSKYNVDIEGYHYLKAVLARNPNSALQSQTVIQSLRLHDNGYIGHDWSIQYQGEYGKWNDIGNDQMIYIIYEPDSDTPGGGAVGDLAHRKYVTANGDGTYDLTLDVTGAVGTETDPAKVDVVFVLDLSSSMDGEIWMNHQETTILQAAKNAMKTLTSTVSQAKTIDARWKLVTFDTNARIVTGWLNANQIDSKIDQQRQNDDGGTNYERGLTQASNALDDARKDATKVVIFLTDGEPTMCQDYPGYWQPDGCGVDHTKYCDYHGALDGAAKISCDRFFAVGIGLSTDSVYTEDTYWGQDLDLTGEELLEKVAEEVQALPEYKQVVNVTDGDSLNDVFAGIAGSINSYKAANVHISDRLTEEVDPVEDYELVVQVLDKNGTEHPEEIDEGNIHAEYNEETKELELFFDEDYTLVEGYTYSVTITIKPNNIAEELYKNNNYTYPHTGGEGTGETSEGKPGIFTNVKDSAKVTWTTNNELKEEAYNRPVVQLADEPTPPPTTTQELSKEKYVKDNEDGTYDLTLNVSGQVGSLTEKAKVDIVLLVDVSTSMSYDYDWPTTRIQKTKEAVKTLTDTLAGKSDTVDSRWKVLTFGKTGNALTEDWVSSDAAYNAVNGIRIVRGVGTNYEAGFAEAQTALTGARSDAEKIVIFLTDGAPTYAGVNGEIGWGSSTTQEILDSTNTAAGKISCNQFYAVGIGLGAVHVSNDGWGYDTTGREILDDIAAKVSATTRQVYNTADEGTDLTDIFEGIAASITSFLCSNVTITDTLSQWAEVADENAELEIEVTRKDATTGEETVIARSQGGTVLSGATVTLNPTTINTSRATLTANYDNTSKTITLDFPDEYQLEGDLTYYVTVKIAPTIEAYEEYQSNGKYLHKGEEGTDAPDNDTSSNQPGFYSNNTATVTYTYNGVKDTEDYPKPVIQVDNMTTEDTDFITVVKTFSGLSKEQVEEIAAKDHDDNNTNDFTITVTNRENSTKTKTLKLSDDAATVSADGFTYTWKLDGYPAGTYKVEESNADVQNYELTTTGVGESITVKEAGWRFAPNVNKVTISEDVAFTVSDNSVIMIALKNPGDYLVWTKEALSLSQQKAVEEHINGRGDEFKTEQVSEIHFYSGEDTLSAGINYGGSQMIWADNRLNFSPSRQWKHVLAGTYTMTGEDDKQGDIQITNRYVLDEIPVDFQKFGTDYTTEQLTAEFKLEKMITKTDPASGAIKITVPESGSAITEEISSEENEFGRLTAGVYCLTETEAPEGYSLLDVQIYFKVDSTGVKLLTVADNGIITEVNNESQQMFRLKVDGTSGTADAKYTIQIKNKTLYDLPQSGGPGIYLYMLGGVALMMAGTLLVYKKRKEEVLRS